MTQLQSYTTMEQSKKLAKFLLLESADMYYSSVPVREWKDKKDTSKGTQVVFKDQIFALENLPNFQIGEGDTYAWSLAALLNLCPTINGKQPILTRGKITRLWYCYYEDEMDTQTYDNPIDAVFEIIQLLHEQKLI